MKLQKYAFSVIAIVLVFSSALICQNNHKVQAMVADEKVGDSQTALITVNDFFLSEAELPSPWIPDPDAYSAGLHMNVKKKLMGGEWASVKIRNSELTKSIHVHIGYFSSEAEAIKYATPETYIFRTDAYMETGQTFAELLQLPNTAYKLTGASVYGDGGFSGGYQHTQFQPFNVFRVGQVLFHTDASDASTEGILEPLLVNKARRLLGTIEATESTPLDVETPAPQLPTFTPPSQTNPIVLKASLEEKGAVTQTLANDNNYELVTMQGVVTDQAGKGVAGVKIEVVGGANPASTITNLDGSYQLVVNVTGGVGSTTMLGVNFTLQMADLSINRVVLLQAIEGGQLVAARDVGVRVFLNWGLDTPVTAEVTLTLDNQPLPAVQGIAKKVYAQVDLNRGLDAINVIIPKDRFPSWGDSSHTVVVSVKIISPDIVDADLTNNVSAAYNFSLKQTQTINILYVSLDPGIGKSSLVNFAAKAHSYLDKVYPISYSWGFVGTQQVSYYLVSPYANFMKSLDADDLPFGLGDVGIVEGSLEVGKSFSYKAAIIAIEKARRLYNSQRCMDAQGKLILPCPNEVALQAVGVYPDGAFGSSKDGFAYADQRTVWRAAANSLGKPDNVSHELGHLFGFGEEYSGTSIGVPVIGSTWDGVSFRTADGSCVNIMGSVGLACSWINAQTWNSLIDNSLKLNKAPWQTVASLSFLPRYELLAAEVEAPALLIEGVITSEGLGFIQQVSSVNRYQQSDQQPQGTFKLEALDAYGNILGTENFDGLFFDLDTNPISVSPFLVALPVDDPSQVVEVRLSAADGQMIDESLRSNASPKVSFDPLPLEIQKETVISWQAEDADDTALLSTLYYSNNAGITWHLLAIDSPVTSFSVDATELPGGQAIFKVSVSDGFNAATSVSKPVVMPNQPPLVTIIEPWGATFDVAENVLLEAVAYDLEDGLLPSQDIQWFDAQGILLGTGSLLQISLPNTGIVQITAQATDSAGQLAEAATGITITGTQSQPNSPASVLPINKLYLFAGGVLAVLLLTGLLVGAILIFNRNKRWGSVAVSQGQIIQDQQGNHWFQQPGTGRWQVWNGSQWQQASEAPSNLLLPLQTPTGKPSRRSSCLLSLLTVGILGLIVIGGISLLVLNFFPGYRVYLGGDDSYLLLKTGAGLLALILGFLLVRSGFNTIITKQAVIVNDQGRKQQKQGCGAVLYGMGKLVFGMLLLIIGLGLMTLFFYQVIFPLFVL